MTESNVAHSQWRQKRHRAKKRHLASRAAVNDTSYFEVDLAETEDISFYSGFSDDIIGIFIPTFALRPLGKKIAIKLIYKRGSHVALSGHVEWLREYNPMIPETYPGIGVRLEVYGRRTSAIIESFVSTHPSLFFDNSFHATSPHPEKTEVLHQADVYRKISFYDGLVKDVANILMQECRVDEVVEQTVTPTELIATVVSSQSVKHNFNGGFDENDPKHRIFVETCNVRPIGTQVYVCLVLEDGWQIRGTGLIKWARKHNPMVSYHVAPPGLGICLTQVSASAWQHAFPDIADQKAPITCVEY